jgi:hypothetical protein
VAERWRRGGLFVFVLVTSRILENVHPDLVAAGRHAKASRSSAILSRRFPGCGFFISLFLALRLLFVVYSTRYSPTALKTKGEDGLSQVHWLSDGGGLGDGSAPDFKNPLKEKPACLKVSSVVSRAQRHRRMFCRCCQFVAASCLEIQEQERPMCSRQPLPLVRMLIQTPSL